MRKINDHSQLESCIGYARRRRWGRGRARIINDHGVCELHTRAQIDIVVRDAVALRPRTSRAEAHIPSTHRPTDGSRCWQGVASVGIHVVHRLRCFIKYRMNGDSRLRVGVNVLDPTPPCDVERASVGLTCVLNHHRELTKQ